MRVKYLQIFMVGSQRLNYLLTLHNKVKLLKPKSVSKTFFRFLINTPTSVAI